MKRLIFATVILVSPMLAAQPVSIPTLQVCNAGKVNGSANLYFSRRDDIDMAGTIDITVSNVSCDPQSSSPYPTGTITMRFSLTESSVSDVQVTLVEQMTTVGKHTPTTYMNGRCIANGGTVPCHFWLMFADNKVLSIDTPGDVVGVLVVDRLGNRLAYGTGPIRTGDISITPF